MFCFYMYEPGRHRMDTGNVIVCREKHGTNYWPANTPDEFAASCAAILKQRVKDGWYQEWGEPTHLLTPLTDEQYEALPEGRVKEFAKAQREEVAHALASYKRHNHNVKAILRIAESEDIAKLIEVRHRKTDALLRYETLASRALQAFEDIDKLECVSLENPFGD